MIRPATLGVWTLASLPALIALGYLASEDWRTTSNVLDALGRLTGVAGLGFLLVAAILSSRVPGFDRHFGGLTKLWKVHHYLAAIAFLLLLAHPLLLALAYAGQSLSAAVAVLFPNLGYWETWLGWGALLTLMVFIAPSFAFFGRPEYQRWKRLHKLAAVTVLLSLGHSIALARTVPHPWDIWLWSGFAALAIAAVAYRFLFSRAWLHGLGGRLPYRVAAVDRVANNVVELRLQAIKQRLEYEPGQYVYLTPFDKDLTVGYGEEHPFTVSSSPAETDLRIAIKDLGDASRAIQAIRPDTTVRVEGPYGAFFASEYGGSAELWIAGGIGITPFLSRARHLEAVTDSVDIQLVYCVQDESRALFASELDEIAERLPGFVLHRHYFYQQGPLGLAFLEQRCPDFRQRAAYICGPGALLHSAQTMLLGAGVARNRLVTEEFDLL